jgi:hypothetical protein
MNSWACMFCRNRKPDKTNPNVCPIGIACPLPSGILVRGVDRNDRMPAFVSDEEQRQQQERGFCLKLERTVDSIRGVISHRPIARWSSGWLWLGCIYGTRFGLAIPYFPHRRSSSGQHHANDDSSAQASPDRLLICFGPVVARRRVADGRPIRVSP